MCIYTFIYICTYINVRVCTYVHTHMLHTYKKMSTHCVQQANVSTNEKKTQLSI